MRLSSQTTISEKVLTLCLETSTSLARELTEEEIRQALETGKITQVVERLWEFTGHFYKWPEILIKKKKIYPLR